MTTPNLDATGHWWVGALARFNFELEYQKGHDNTMANMLTWVTAHLDLDTVKSILDGVTLGAAHWAEVYNPTIVESDDSLEQEVYVATGCVLVQMHVTDWTKAQKEDQTLEAVLNWLEVQKRQIWRHFWQTMPLVRKAGWFCEINRTSSSTRGPYTCMPCLGVRMKNFWFLWYLKHIV